MPVERFKSKEAYRKNLAYRHMHGIPFTAKNVVVGGKEHEVKHSTDPRREAIDAKQKSEMAQFKGEAHGYSFKRPKRKVLSRYSQ